MRLYVNQNRVTVYGNASPVCKIFDDTEGFVEQKFNLVMPSGEAQEKVFFTYYHSPDADLFKLDFMLHIISSCNPEKITTHVGSDRKVIISVAYETFVWDDGVNIYEVADPADSSPVTPSSFYNVKTRTWVYV